MRIAAASAGCALEAAEAVASGASGLAYALCRPPSHDARWAKYGGVCHFSNAALATGRPAAMGGVSVLDTDFHHGAGTQEFTYCSDGVIYVSVRGEPNVSFPFFYGYASERSEWAGKGYNLNLPLGQGTDWAVYRPDLQRTLDAIADKECRSLVVSAGFDTCQGDPLG